VKLLWNGSWTDTPGFLIPEAGVLIEVELALPLWKIENASGRRTSRPLRKVVVFLITDGPGRTFRKARTKRNESAFTGEFRVALILGRDHSSGARVVVLALRVPPAAQQLVVHRQLVQQVDDSFSVDDFVRSAQTLASEAGKLESVTRQSYLNSGMQPPEELVDSMRKALINTMSGPVSSTLRSRIIRPPASSGVTDTMTRLAAPVQGTGMPVAVLGAGDYVRTETLPALRSRGFSPYCIADREPHIAAAVGRSHHFQFATTDPERAIAALPDHALVVVATAHDSHSSLACLAADAGHRVFLEKPPAVTAQDVARLARAMASHPGAVEIGYNRRYHPLVRRARDRIRRRPGPTSITCTVKELPFQPDHWYFWANQGTRVTGNLCHWIDLAVFFLDDGVLPVSVALSPRVIGSVIDDEERVLTVTFDDGSLLTILGTSRGDDIRGVQEHIDIRRGTTSITIDDLWKMNVRSGGIGRTYRTLFRDKAHTRMYREALGRIARGEAATYKLWDMIVVSAIQVTASDLVRDDGCVSRIPSWLADVLEENVDTTSS
jgi:predicted dehydrogenase